mgnify:CR=1 FL=1
MRNSERIPVILDTLRKAWEANPDLRLCQLLGNMASQPLCDTSDMYYVEDDKLLVRLREVYLKDASE